MEILAAGKLIGAGAAAAGIAGAECWYWFCFWWFFKRFI